MPITLTASTPNGTDLISTDRAALNATLSALNVSNPDLLAALITAASEAIERYCKRQFTLQAYTEIYNGEGLPYLTLHLSNFPVVEITRIATCPQQVLLITNSSTANQRATVSTTSTGLRLYRMTAGVPSTTDLAFSSYVTLASLVTAIGLLGNGWTASVLSPYGSYPSADLLAVQGAITVKNGAWLEMYKEDSSEGWRLDAPTGIITGQFPQGTQNIRVDYRAGFSTIPSPVQEACVQHVLDVYQSSLQDSKLKSVSIGPYSQTFDNTVKKIALSSTVAGWLSPYMDVGKMVNRRGPNTA